MLEYQDPCKNPTFRLRKHVRRNFSSYQLQLYVCVVLHQISKCMHAACDEVDKYMMCRDSTWSGAYTRSGQANVVGTPCVWIRRWEIDICLRPHRKDWIVGPGPPRNGSRCRRVDLQTNVPQPDETDGFSTPCCSHDTTGTTRRAGYRAGLGSPELGSF
jgi:hypothetical protein